MYDVIGLNNEKKRRSDLCLPCSLFHNTDKTVICFEFPSQEDLFRFINSAGVMEYFDVRQNVGHEKYNNSYRNRRGLQFNVTWPTLNSRRVSSALLQYLSRESERIQARKREVEAAILAGFSPKIFPT